MEAGLDPALAEIITEVWHPRRLVAAPIPGGITNRNYRVDVEAGSFVVRLPGKDTDLLGISREAERVAAEGAARAGVGPEVERFLADRGCLITRFIEGEPIPEERMREPEMLSLVVEAIRRLHGGMGEVPSTFVPFRVVEAYRQTAIEHGVTIPREYEPLHDRALEIEAAFSLHPMPIAPCHNDLLNANFLLENGRVRIVDYEYAGMGDPFFDLANFSVNNLLDDGAQRELIRLYFGGVTSARSARLQLMRIMSDFREAMWGVVQQGISTLDVDYVGYASKHFARCLAFTGDDHTGWLREAAEEPA